MRSVRSSSSLVYLFDLHLKSGLRRFAMDEVDVEVSTPVVITDPCGTHGPDFITGSLSDPSTTPITPASCSYSITPTTREVTQDPGTGTIALTTTCAWRAFSFDTWLRLTGATAGTSSASIAYSFDANTSDLTRVARISIQDKIFTLTQLSKCRVTLAPTFLNATRFAGASAFSIGIKSTCAWTAVVSAAWIIPTFLTAGTGAYLFRFSYTANTGVARIGTIRINDKVFTIFQAEGEAEVVVVPPPPSGGAWHYYRQTSTPEQEAWYPAGVLMGHVDSGSPSWADSASRLLALPVLLVQPRTVGALGVYLTVAGTAGSKGRFAIYKATSRNNPYPDALIVDSAVATGADIDTGSISIPKKEHIINTALLEDTLYWFCWICDAATRPQMRQIGSGGGSVRAFGVVGFSDPITSVNGNSETVTGFYKNSVTYPANAGISLPVVFPASATLYNAGTGHIPFLGYTLTA